MASPYSVGPDGSAVVDYNGRQLSLGSNVRVGPDGTAYVIGSDGQYQPLGGTYVTDNGRSIMPVDSNGSILDAGWQAQQDQQAGTYRAINGHTPGIAVNDMGYSAGAYSPSDISGANGFGTQFNPGSSYAAQLGDYSASNASLGQAASTAQLGDNDAYQRAALAQNYGVMNGAPSLGYQQALQSLQSGGMANQAAASSALGGGLGQVAALRQNAQNAGGYYASGMQQAAAIQAQAQDQARQQYAQQLSAMRTSGQQGVNANQSIAGTYAQNAQDRASFAQQQNQLHDQASLYGQNMAQQMKGSNYAQQQKEADMRNEAQHASQQYKNQASENQSKLVSAGASSGASLLGGLISDARTKEPLSLGHAAEMRLWR